MGTISKILSGTAVLVGVYLVLSQAKNTSSIVSSLGSVYSTSVKTLQGR